MIEERQDRMDISSHLMFKETKKFKSSSQKSLSYTCTAFKLILTFHSCNAQFDYYNRASQPNIPSLSCSIRTQSNVRHLNLVRDCQNNWTTCCF